MNKKRIISLLIIGGIIVLVFVVRWLNLCIQIDSCLDKGGRWNYELNECEESYQISKNQTVYADKNMIATVLRNLISNAIKFTNRNGSVRISSNIEINSNLIKISVTDTGIGIPQDKIDNLFRIDKNISTEGTEQEKGTGLGLILCKEFIEKHKGEICVESKEENGTTFSFTILKEQIQR